MKSIDWTRGLILSRLLGLISFVLGVTCAMEAYRLWTGWAGSGVLPAAVSIVFVVLAVGFAAFPTRDTEAKKRLERAELRGVLLITVAFAVYLVAAPMIGFLVSTWAFLFVTTRFAAGSSTRAALLWSGFLSIGSHLAFKVSLGTPLPAGPFGF